MKKYSILFLICVAFNLNAQELDTIFLKEKDTITGLISVINDNILYYSSNQNGVKTGGGIYLNDINKIVINKKNKPFVSINDIDLKRKIIQGERFEANIQSKNAEMPVTKNNALSTPDSIISNEQKIEKLYNDINDIKYNLYSCHSQYKTGTKWIVTGGIVSLTGSIIIIHSLSFIQKYNGTYNKSVIDRKRSLLIIGDAIAGVGGAISLIGGIIQIDSHKYIGRASISFGATGAGINIKF